MLVVQARVEFLFLKQGGENDETLEICISAIACSFRARGNCVRWWPDA
jgi:hypothetical protein